MDKYSDKRNSDDEPPMGFWKGLMSIEWRNQMDLTNFIVWLTAGAVIGWFAHRMVNGQRNRQADKQTPFEDVSSE